MRGDEIKKITFSFSAAAFFLTAIFALYDTEMKLLTFLFSMHYSAGRV